MHIKGDPYAVFNRESSPAAAVVQIEGNSWKFGADGRVLEKVSQDREGAYPQVMGLAPIAPTVGEPLVVPEGEQEKLEALKRFLSTLGSYGMAEEVNTFIDLSQEDVIYFGYGSDATVKVPSSANFSMTMMQLRRIENALKEAGEEFSGTLELTWGDLQARLLPERWMPASESTAQKDEA